jgi:hypothetical protein
MSEEVTDMPIQLNPVRERRKRDALIPNPTQYAALDEASLRDREARGHSPDDQEN